MVQKWLRAGYNTRVCQLSLNCLSAPKTSFIAGSVILLKMAWGYILSVEGAVQTLREEGASLSVPMLFHVLLLVPTKSSYQQCVVGTAWALVPLYFQQHLQDGFSVSHRHPAGELPASVHLYPEGKRCFLLACSASPLVVSCLPGNSRPALAQGDPQNVPIFYSHTFINTVWIPDWGGDPFSAYPFLHTLPLP